MKTKMILFLLVAFIAAAIAQSGGKLTVMATTSNPGGKYTPENVVAIWVQNSSNALVNTMLYNTNNGNSSAADMTVWFGLIKTWASRNTLKNVDGITSATNAGYGVKTCYWGKTVDISAVPDGVYTVKMEIANTGVTAVGSPGHEVASYTFTKGPAASTGVVSGAASPSFSNVSVQWLSTITPSIALSSYSLTGFSYNKGSGPSVEQSFGVSGSVLASDVVITPSANIQISKTSGTGFVSTPLTLTPIGSLLASTPIYVRLKDGLNFGNYNDSIIVSSTGITSQKVMCSGTVVGPSITKSVSSISGLGYNKGSGPSSEQSFTLSGSVLESNITLTPTSNIQISKTSGAGFVNTPLILTQSSGAVNTTTIYVRLKAGLNFADYNAENIAITSTNVVTQNVACSGTVVGPTITSSLYSITGVNYNRGTGPSFAKICTVSASLLEANMVITPPTNYEISTNNSTYSSTPITLTPVSGTISAMSLYIRLKGGLRSGLYSENITIASTGALTKTIACSGSVLGPNVLVSTSTLSGLNYPFDNGPSDQQSFTVSGADLTSNIIVTPNSNFQISTVSGGSFSTSAITLTSSAMIVNSTIIYVRLKAGLVGTSYNGDITITSTNADTKSVSCSGTVDNGTGLTYIATVPVASKACYIGGTMTSGTIKAMNIIDATHYIITIPGATLTDTYNFYSGPNVMYVEKDINGGAVTARSYSADNVVATWAAIYDTTPYYNIATQVGANGTLKDGNLLINTGTAVSVASGTTKTFTLTPSAGYEVATFTYNGADVKSQIVNNQYTTPAVVANATLYVTFSKAVYHLAIKSAESGTSDLVCEYGATPSFRFSPSVGWKISTVMYNGVDVTASLVNGVFAVPSITANALLTVTFELATALNVVSNNRVKVYSTQSSIVVEGTTAGETISLITAGGVQLKSIVSTGERIIISAPQGNTYLVKTATKTVKVAL